MPANPGTWLLSAGRLKAIDVIRRRTPLDSTVAELAKRVAHTQATAEDLDSDQFGDDRLPLIFTCCQPALQPDACVAMTLREVCGLTTEDRGRIPHQPPTTWIGRKSLDFTTPWRGSIRPRL